MKLTHIDEVHANRELAAHNHALERVERAVAAAVLQGHEEIAFKTLGFPMTSAIDRELREAGLKYLKAMDKIVWGNALPDTDK